MMTNWQCSTKSAFYLGIALLIPVLSGCTSSDRNGKISTGGINILIMGEDADSDTVPRSSGVFKRVLSGLSNELHDEGFNVYDETAVTMDHSTQGRTRRVDQEIIDIARSVKRPPIDVATIFSIYYRDDKNAYTRKIYTRIEGRLLNVQTGQRLGNFEVELPQPDNVKRDCNRECILETVGKNAKVLAQDLGAALSAKLSHRVQGSAPRIATGANTPQSLSSTSSTTPASPKNKGLPSAYTLVFNGFDPAEIIRIENEMVKFKGYSHHRLITSSIKNNEYWYETDARIAGLKRDLGHLLASLGIKGRLVLSRQQFVVQKITVR